MPGDTDFEARRLEERKLQLREEEALEQLLKQQFHQKVLIIKAVRSARHTLMRLLQPSSQQISSPWLALEIKFDLLAQVLAPRVLTITRTTDGSFGLFSSIERISGFAFADLALMNETFRTHTVAFGGYFTMPVLFNAITDILFCRDRATVIRISSFPATLTLARRNHVQHLAVKVEKTGIVRDIAMAVRHMGYLKTMILVAPDYAFDHQDDWSRTLEQIKEIRVKDLAEWRDKVERELREILARAQALWTLLESSGHFVLYKWRAPLVLAVMDEQELSGLLGKV